MPVVLALLLLCAVPSSAQTVYPVEFIYTTVKEYPTLMAADPAREAADRVGDLNRNIGAGSFGKVGYTLARTVVHHLPLSVADIIGTTNFCATFRSRMNNAAAALTPFVTTTPKTVRVYVWPSEAGRGCYPNAGGYVINVPVWTSFVHEMGHILGLNHAQSLVRNGTTSYSREYGDCYDGMGGGSCNGYGRLHQFKSESKEALGWFDASYRIDTVTTSGTYTLPRYDTQIPGRKALKVGQWVTTQVWGGSLTTFRGVYLDYMPDAQVPGVPVRSGGQHLDLDLGAGELWALPLGQSVIEQGMALTLLSMTPTEAVIAVDFSGAVSPVPPTPIVSVGPAVPPTPTVSVVSQ